MHNAILGIAIDTCNDDFASAHAARRVDAAVRALNRAAAQYAMLRLAELHREELRELLKDAVRDAVTETGIAALDL